MYMPVKIGFRTRENGPRVTRVGAFVLVDTDSPRRAHRGLAEQHDQQTGHRQDQAGAGLVLACVSAGGMTPASTNAGAATPASTASGNSAPPHQARDQGRPETPRYPLVPVLRICTHVRTPNAWTRPVR
jgi:hypothetical protein